LNFVNNFSEVSAELVEELKGEATAGNHQEVLALADDLTQNLEKISHHGKRADAIVKGMLQHSRTSNGEKQLTHINALVDEYLRLAYHGLRAKDKEFNASLITNFDPSLRQIEVVPQELGRVLLNLFNNAFYATQQKKVHLNGQYQPEVLVSTKEAGNNVEIRVKDNGTGIPESVKSKIFQPFFTTKPTGEGTGLGLSLSYDIITKGHGGKLFVNTQENNFTEFLIILPIT
jgi:signal transduction histidine kinase